MENYESLNNSLLNISKLRYKNLAILIGAEETLTLNLHYRSLKFSKITYSRRPEINCLYKLDLDLYSMKKHQGYLTVPRQIENEYCSATAAHL